jgi:cytochrome c
MIDTSVAGGHSNRSNIMSGRIWRPSATASTENRKEKTMKGLILASAIVIGASASAFAQDLTAGENSFKKCLPCHRVGEGAKNLVGPELNGLEGRKSGSAEGYSYSEANKNSGITWDEAVFKEYITNPRAKIPGTKMVFAGISSENERSNLWAYLKQFDATGKKK